MIPRAIRVKVGFKVAPGSRNGGYYKPSIRAAIRQKLAFWLTRP